MAKNKRDKEIAKAERAAKRAQRKQTWKQMWQAFQMQRKQDSLLIPYMLLGFVLPIVLLLALSTIFGVWWVNLILGIVIGVMVAMFIFSRRLQNGLYSRIEGEAGAAGWALTNMRDGVGMKWITATAVQTNTHLDAVHRVVGTPGIVLVGEGARHRLKPMMAQERRRLSRILGDTPIYDVYVGNGEEHEDEVPIKKLQSHLMRLPRNIKKDQVDALNSRVASIERLRSREAQLPKGPIPKGAKMSGMNRRARRAAERNK